MTWATTLFIVIGTYCYCYSTQFSVHSLSRINSALGHIHYYHTNRAAVLQNLNRLEEALNDCNKAIELEPDFPQAYFNRGILLIKVKMFDEAISDLTKFLELEPGNAMAYYNRGIAEYYKGKKDVACGDIQQAAKLGVPNALEMFNKFCH